jgi:ribosome-binding protein aMBF1 (putative translation factor)
MDMFSLNMVSNYNNGKITPRRPARSVGNLIKEARELRNMSQLELGTAIGIDTKMAQQHISKYERDIIRVPTDVLMEISRVLKIHVMIYPGTIFYIPLD